MFYFVLLLTNKGEGEDKTFAFSLPSIFLRLLHPTQPTPAQANIDTDLSSGEYYKKTRIRAFSLPHLNPLDHL